MFCNKSARVLPFDPYKCEKSLPNAQRSEQVPDVSLLVACACLDMILFFASALSVLLLLVLFLCTQWSKSKSMPILCRSWPSDHHDMMSNLYQVVGLCLTSVTSMLIAIDKTFTFTPGPCTQPTALLEILPPTCHACASVLEEFHLHQSCLGMQQGLF